MATSTGPCTVSVVTNVCDTPDTQLVEPWRPKRLSVALASPAIAVIATSFLPWTERGQRNEGAPGALILVIVISVLAAAALATYCHRKVFQVMSLAAILYAWTCLYSAAAFSSSEAHRRARAVDVAGNELGFRPGFYLAVAALGVTTVGWAAVVAHARIRSRRRLAAGT